jgi:hypothetical protein
LHTGGKKNTGWWKMGIWRLKGMRGNVDKGVCRKEEGGSYILQCEGTRVWRDRWLERKFTGIHPEIGIKKIASNKTRGNWTKTAKCIIKLNKNGKGELKRVTKEMKYNGQQLYIYI